MKTYMSITSVPASGVLTIKEGNLTRVFFDIEPLPATEENDNENQYSCENVDIVDSDYSKAVAAIVTSRYDINNQYAILANYDESKDPNSDLTDAKRAEYLQEYADFQLWRKKAKEVALLID